MLNASVLVFDVDDTLTQTARYIFQALQHHMLARGQYDPDLSEKLDILSYAVSPRTGIAFPQAEQDQLSKLVWEVVISRPDYMLESKPTELFNHYFKQHHPDFKGKRIALCTHRGFAADAKSLTRLWLKKHRSVVNIEDVDCHFLCSRVPGQRNKVEWLRRHYGNDFLLIDDNPFYDRTVVHDADPNVVIYDKCRQYVAYKNQRILSIG